MTRHPSEECLLAVAEGGGREADRAHVAACAECGSRVEEARASLSREAAGIAAELAIELLEKELTDADRERIFTSTLERLKARAAGGVQ